MDISRYASRLSLTSAVLPSGRPSGPVSTESHGTDNAADQVDLPSNHFSQNLPQEPDDARITGGTRSLSRRLLALNIPALTVARRKTGSPTREPSPQRPAPRNTPAGVRKPLHA